MQVVAVKSDIFKGITAIAEGQYFDSPGGLLKEGFSLAFGERATAKVEPCRQPAKPN